MNDLNKIIYNCRKATFLIEKKQLSRLTVREQLELRVHIAGCSICRTFQRQSILINGQVRNIFQSRMPDSTLPEAFKKDLQERINKELEK
ncbi:MAG: hypothetical protein H7Y42_19820 [Chitinophagaceae bacterium]|nr:hypothetical protein [Chitinophagaceae bacterium]